MGSSFGGCAARAAPALGRRPSRRGRHEKTTKQRLTKPDLMAAEFVRSRERPSRTHSGGAGRGSSVLLLGLIRLVIGFIANLAILETIGIISLVIGAVLSILRWDARLVVLVAPGAYQGPDWGRLAAVLSACDGYLEGLRLRCAAEGVVGRHEAVQPEPLAHELLWRELALGCGLAVRPTRMSMALAFPKSGAGQWTGFSVQKSRRPSKWVATSGRVS
jgi:hypothetical protein